MQQQRQKRTARREIVRPVISIIITKFVSIYTNHTSEIIPVASWEKYRRSTQKTHEKT